MGNSSHCTIEWREGFNSLIIVVFTTVYNTSALHTFLYAICVIIRILYYSIFISFLTGTSVQWFQYRAFWGCRFDCIIRPRAFGSIVSVCAVVLWDVTVLRAAYLHPCLLVQGRNGRREKGGGEEGGGRRGRMKRMKRYSREEECSDVLREKNGCG